MAERVEPSMLPFVGLGVGVGVFAAVFGILAVDAATAKPAPVDVALTDELGRHVELSSFRGKVVVLEFWATWCPACAWEADQLDAFVGAHPETPVLSVSLDDHLEPVAQWVADHHPRHDVFWHPHGKGDHPPRITAYPTVFVLDEDGAIATRLSGVPDADAIADAVAAVRTDG